MISRLVSVICLHLVCASFCLAENVAYYMSAWNGAKIHVVTANLNSPELKVTVSLTKNGPGTAESFGSMINRLQPSAAITGTFFCTKSLQPTGDIVIDGTRVHRGTVGTGVCFTADNTVHFVPFTEGSRTGWQGYETVLCAGPTLVSRGRLAVNPRAQGFRDPGIFGKKRRTALGVTENNKLLLVAIDTPMELHALAKVMLHLGAAEAVDLDGGSSSALYQGGRHISKPNRTLTNLVLVYDNLTDYHRNLHALAPQLGKRVAVQPPPYPEAGAVKLPEPGRLSFDLKRVEALMASNALMTFAEQQTNFPPFGPEAEAMFTASLKVNRRMNDAITAGRP